MTKKVEKSPPVRRELRRWAITIPGWRPVSTNKLVGKHHMKAASHKRTDRDMVMAFAAGYDVPPAVGKRRISLEITLVAPMKKYDPDNYWKSTNDACKHAGLIHNDTEEWVEDGTVTQTMGGSMLITTIIIEELE